jgi:ketosteroid isomerase-like protein
MSQENVEVIRSFFEAWSSGDIDRAYDAFHPDAVMTMEGDWPEPGPYVGREAVLRWDEQFREAYDSVSVETPTDFLHAADRVAARYRFHGEGHGPPTTLEVTIVHGVRHGKIRSVEFFWDHQEALEAVGLSG